MKTIRKAIVDLGNGRQTVRLMRYMGRLAWCRESWGKTVAVLPEVDTITQAYHQIFSIQQEGA